VPVKKTPFDGGPAVTSDPPPEALLDAALRLLGARARSVRELRDRLLKKKFGSSEVSHCIRWLLDRSLLNDEAFARALTRDRLRFSPRSPFLLKREATLRGVDPFLAGEVVDAVLEEEGVSAEDLSALAAEGWVRKQGSVTRRELLASRFDPKGERARRRLYGFLARRGFAGDVARRGLEAGEEKARELEGDPGEQKP
jgi:regulatory protein